MTDLPVNQVCFPQDTKRRKEFFKAASFSHPAKMSLGLQIYLIEHYTKPGDIILDPMAGSGTILVGAAIGRHIIAIELESKFCDMMRQNWEKIKSLGPLLGNEMGAATIIQGDARNLEGVLADCVISSPPFAGNTGGLKSARNFKYGSDELGKRMMGGIKGGTGENPDNIDNLPYGSIDKIISSPPYEKNEAFHDKNWKPPHDTTDLHKTKYAPTKENIGNLKSASYLEAMAQVYRGCYAVLKDKGLLILVVKNFIRKGQVVRLDSDTIRLCENAGFSLQERLKRRLTQFSFWRTLEKKRWEKQGKEYPSDMTFEHILIFRKE